MTKTEGKPDASPEDLLKAAVSGRPDVTAEPGTTSAALKGASRLPAWLRDVRLLGTAAAALALGTALGAGVTALSHPHRAPDEMAALSATLEAGRIETARLGGEIARLHQALAELKTTTESARKDAAVRGTAIGERLAQVERGVGGKLTALSERIDQSERDQSARLASLSAQAERRPVAPAAVAKAEPTQTGSLSEAKTADPKSLEGKGVEAKAKAVAEKPAVIDGWAVRDVFNGAAILENRRRHIVEVGPGDTLPGVGRIEAVERRGHDWVVITRQGIVTAQPW